ncbi:MAG TPA: hypothetical protein VKR60_07850 [Candidatus Sulfotelmatobacter sp.]|nr:hypothetical protein [Candidatus Sulfotelmatobacter sp.]
MKFATVSKSLVLGLALMLASSAFAAEKGKLQIYDPVNVSGATLKPGEYKLEWTGTDNVEVSIMQGKKLVAKVAARRVDLNSPSANDAAVVSKGDNGTTTLSGVRFEGKKYALELGLSNDGMQTGSSK